MTRELQWGRMVKLVLQKVNEHFLAFSWVKAHPMLASTVTDTSGTPRVDFHNCYIVNIFGSCVPPPYKVVD